MKFRISQLTAAAFALGLIASGSAHSTFGAEPGKVHRIVFDISGSNPKQWQVVLHNVAALQKAFGRQNTRVEVVAYGPGLDLLLSKDTALAPALRSAAGTGVVLAACENTMRARHLTRSALFPFATPVDSGVAEIVRKEEAGWTYIKGG